MSLPSILDGMTPADLGLPSKFTEFREIQCETVDFALYGHGGESANRFKMIGAPPGAGKTLVGQAVAKMSGMKAMTLTATLGLEDQILLKDKFDVVDIRGRANYPCHHKPRLSMKAQDLTCDEGEDHGCPDAGSPRCRYTAQVNRVKTSKNGLSNYPYWMTVRGRNAGALEVPEKRGTNGKVLVEAQPIELLILDELHLSVEALSRHLATWVSLDNLATFGNEAMLRDAMRTLRGKQWAVVEKEWQALFATMLVQISHEMKRLDVRMAVIADEQFGGDKYAARRDSRAYREAFKEWKTLGKLKDDINRVAMLGNDGNWIWEAGRSGVRFNCIWPYRYAEQYLFSGVKHVVGLSATLRPKCLSLLGLKRSEYDYKEWPRVFPPQNTPVYYWPRGRMGRTASAEDVDAVCEAMDECFERWPDDKTIVHTVSYDRAEMFQARCRKAGRYMILSRPGEAQRAAEEYRTRTGPAWLVSPSFTTGWDFPDSEARMVIVPKIPFLHRGDSVVQARLADDHDFENYEIGQVTQQACYRGTRHERDYSRVFILDKAWGRMRYAVRPHCSRWFGSREIGSLAEAR